MSSQSRPNRSIAVIVAVLTFSLTLAIRIWGINSRLWLLSDQMRDWTIAQGSFWDLPLIGPATHVGGYTLGPAFYWILWLIRVVVGPFFDNLPHAGGIGQAVLGSLADTLLLAAVWRRTGLLWTALTAVILVSTGGFDVCLAAVIWSPIVGATLAKIATALVLLDWHRGSMPGRVATAGVAWAAVHAYTGAIYVAVSVFLAFLIDPLVRRDWRMAKQNAVVLVAVVVLLQVPLIIHQFSRGPGQQAMGAVTDSIAAIVTGRAQPEVDKSVRGYLAAVQFIQGTPWTIPALGWILVICGGVVALRYRHDAAILLMTVMPAVLSVAGYALFLAPLDYYYYFSLMPSAVLIVVLALTSVPRRNVALWIGVALCVGAVAVTPARIRFSRTLHQMPEYGPLVQGSRTAARRGVPMRAVRTEFPLPPTGDPEYIYLLLGGRIERSSRWLAVIAKNGSVTYQDIGGT
jgi:hypothetical protein